jgi:hypothetical protein
MQIEEATEKMEELERRWFEAYRAADVAREEMAVAVADELPATAFTSAHARLEEAERRKREIMNRIEEIEALLIA